MKLGSQHWVYVPTAAMNCAGEGTSVFGSFQQQVFSKHLPWSGRFSLPTILGTMGTHLLPWHPPQYPRGTELVGQVSFPDCSYLMLPPRQSPPATTLLARHHPAVPRRRPQAQPISKMQRSQPISLCFRFSELTFFLGTLSSPHTFPLL